MHGAGTPSGLAAGNPWFCEYGPDLSRGFRALEVWFALKEHGIRALAGKVEDNCDQAAYLAKKVDAHPDLERVAPVSLNIVCFRFVGPAGTDLGHLSTVIVMDLAGHGDRRAVNDDPARRRRDPRQHHQPSQPVC